MNLRIGIDARMPDGIAGGIQQMVIGIASGLAELDTKHRYFFLANPGAEAWLAPHLPRNAEIVTSTQPRPTNIGKILASRVVRPLWQHVAARSGPLALKLPKSDGTIERLGVDVVHFTWQQGFVTDIPSIYHPHDLQHVHLPGLLSPRERAGRDVLYRSLGHQAKVVAVSSQWARLDMIEHLHLSAEKVRVVPLAPATASYPMPSEANVVAVKAKWDLPKEFIFYPAQTWPHKNHLRLLDALARLRDRNGLVVPLVCSGAINDHFSLIKNRVTELGLNSTVIFVGFVSPIDLQVLYRLARLVVIPTLFEAASFPLWEAFLAGTAVACAAVTSLPEQAGDAALLFDPNNTDSISLAIKRLWSEPLLCKQLAERGKTRVAALSWRATASSFNDLYEQIARR